MNPAISGVTESDRHLRFGWTLLFVSVLIGIGLETLHGFKGSWYLDVGNEVRRLMFTLAHAHATGLALVNIAAGLTVRNVAGFRLRSSVSFALIWSSIVMPAGFLLGGIVVYGGDPGLGVWLVPIGAALLLYAIGGIALEIRSTRESTAIEKPAEISRTRPRRR